MEWDGPEHHRHDEIADLTREMRALDRTIKEMHNEQLDAMDRRRLGTDEKLVQMADAIHALALALQSGDSKLAIDLATHIATAHHAGTVQRLDSHEGRLDGHDAAIGKLKQRLGVEDGRREAHTARQQVNYFWLTIIVAGMVGLAQAAAQLVGSVWQTMATLFTGRVGS